MNEKNTKPAVRRRQQDAPQSAYVFATATGGHISADNFGNRVVAAAVKLSTSA